MGAAAGNDLFLSTSFTLSCSRALSIPNKCPALAGIGGCCSSTKAFSTFKGSLRAGNGGGNDGLLDARGSSAILTPGLIVSAFNGVLPYSTLRTSRLGGGGVRLEGLYAGAIIRPASPEGVLEIDVLAVPLDRFEIVEMFDKVEAIDSDESRLTRGAGGLRAGRDGDDCKEFTRGGSRGGAIGFADFKAS